jgi:hypothetical protein
MCAQGYREHVGATPVAVDLVGDEFRGVPAGMHSVKAGLGSFDPGSRASVRVGRERVSEKSCWRRKMIFTFFKNG